VDYEVLPAVVDPAKAKGAPAIHEAAPDNACYVWRWATRRRSTARLQGGARHQARFRQQPPDTERDRAARANATYSRAEAGYTLYVASQNPHVERLLMTAFVLGLPENKVRVVAPDVGGGFGSKIYLYPEDVVVTWAAKQLNRAVKWTAERTESFVSDAHGRDHVTRRSSRWTRRQVPAMRVRTTRTSERISRPLRLASRPSCTHAPRRAVHHAAHLLRGTAVFTNTTPVGTPTARRAPRADLRRRAAGRNGRARNEARPGRIRRKKLHRQFLSDAGRAVLRHRNYEATLDAVMRCGRVGVQAEKGRIAQEGQAARLGTPATSRPAASRLERGRSLVARARSFEAERSACIRPATVTVFTGSHSHGQGPRPRSRRWSPTASACRWRT